MGEYLREMMKRHKALVGGDPPKPRIAPLVVVVAVLASGFLIAGAVRLSVVAVIFAVVFAAAGWTWWISDRAPSRSAEIRFAALSLVCLLVGFFGWALGMIKGW